MLRVIAIDLGTTKVVTVMGEKNENGSYRILAYGEEPSSGINHGQVENILSVSNAVKPTLEAVKNITGENEIREVFVGIAGQHVKCIDNSVDISRDKYDELITEEEIKMLEKSARNLPMADEEDVLHIVSKNYSIDGKDEITDPVGRLGHKLTGHFHVITGNSSSSKCTTLCMNKIGLEVKKKILEPIASARAILSDEEKELGVVLIDIGGGTTDLIIYKNGILLHTAVISYGGNDITREIREKFSLLPGKAEKIKIHFGSCGFPGNIPANRVIEIKGINGRNDQEIPVRELNVLIRDVVEKEIIKAIINEIQPYEKFGIGAGIVFTGGASRLHGLSEFTKEIFGKADKNSNIYVKIGYPEFVSSDSYKINELAHPKYSTVVGLLMCGFDYLERKNTADIIIEPQQESDSDENSGSPKHSVRNVLESFKKFFTAED
jgi:cell division protein FtsA